MAHKQQIEYCMKVCGLFPQYFFYSNVLDIGSMDINGNNRYLFSFCNYTGLDIAAGRNVDAVLRAHKWPARDGLYDTIISTEVAEHDTHYRETMKNAIRMLRPGGLLLFTCATTGRPEHGTVRTDTGSSPYTTDYYQNVTEEMIRDIDGFNDAWQFCKFTVNHESHDLQLMAIKKGGDFRYKPSVLSYILCRCRQFVAMRIRDYENAIKRILK